MPTALPGNACVPPASNGGGLAVPFAGGTQAFPGIAVGIDASPRVGQRETAPSTGPAPPPVRELRGGFPRARPSPRRAERTGPSRASRRPSRCRTARGRSRAKCGPPPGRRSAAPRRCLPRAPAPPSSIPSCSPNEAAFIAVVATGSAGPSTAATADSCARNDRRAARRFESHTRSGAGMAARSSASKRAASVNLAETAGHASVISRRRRR